MTDEGWRDRAIDEVKELSDRLVKLEAFIEAATEFNKLPKPVRGVLMAQRDTMSAYKLLLYTRIYWND